MQVFQSKPVRAEPADQHPGSNHGTALILRRRLRHFCLISPHQKASICNADSVYFRKSGSESLDSFYNKMNGLVNFFQKTAPNLENFNDLYYSKLWVPRKIEGRESQTKLKKTRKEWFQRTCFATWPSKEGSRPILIKTADSRGLQAFTARKNCRHIQRLSRHLGALWCGLLDGDPVHFPMLTKINIFAKDLQNQHR